MTKISTATSQKIKNMSIVCAMLVVTIHVSWPADSACLSTFWVEWLLRSGVSRIAVPFFFLISGYFLSRHFDDSCCWRNELGKRIRSLLIPYVLWSVFSVLDMVPLTVMANLISHRSLGTNLSIVNTDLIKLFGLDLTDYPLLWPLWYVRCLFLFVLITPLFKLVVDRFKIAWLILSFALLVAFGLMTGENECRHAWYLFFDIGWSLSGMFYFSAGIYLQRFEISFSSKRVAIACAVYGITVLLFSAYLESTGRHLAKMFFAFVHPALLYAVWYMMPSCKWAEWFTKCAFPVFLLHVIAFHFFWWASVQHLPQMGPQTKAYLQLAVGIVTPIVSAVILRRLFPKFATIAFGGRS